MHTADRLIAELDAARAWASTQALPLWASQGFDRSARQFEEQLAMDGTPVRGLPRRVMVQARQISAYLLATELGWYDGQELAVAAGQSLVERFWAADGQPGWVFSLTPDGAVTDARRDLYAHAFVLYALAWLAKTPQGGLFRPAIDRTIAFLDETFADRQAGGFWDCLPRQDALRRQNPHMHLLEAELELFVATGASDHLERASRLVDLCLGRFFDPATGALREVFDDHWSVSPGPGQGSVEPGHQCEWAWLLRRYDALAGTDHGAAICAMTDAALRVGIDRTSGRIIDEVDESGKVVSRASRLWPHTEALKILAVETAAGRADYRGEIAIILHRFNTAFCPFTLNGGWIDRLSETDQPLSTAMPASSLYHIMLGLAEVWTGFANSRG